ncbi:MAG: anthranilate/aminodeoxychorismate synthase component II [Rickettsiales bacterium]|nr:anthranilate/aminodeoxychorismate synthase component II [Rickettsiales bacterium]RPG16218.1 MAG: aminodeoxychorismate/anthranilate synthase component II [Pelagibacteraceae bacterium TMED195]
MLILIDNYDSFTYNLVHYFQEIGQSVKVFRNDEISVEKIFKLKPKFLVISPGPSSPKNSGICLELIKKNSKLPKPIPMLGVCLGHQAIAEAFGGIVIQSGKPVHGKVSEIYHENTNLFKNINNPFNATRYHSLIVKKNSIPKNFNITATIKDGTVMAIEHSNIPIFGVQFHPESIATDSGHQLLKNFISFNTK